MISSQVFCLIPLSLLLTSFLLQQGHQDSAMHDRELKTPKIFEELMPSDSVTPSRSDAKPPRHHENSLGFQAASLKQKVAELEQESVLCLHGRCSHPFSDSEKQRVRLTSAQR